MTRKRRRKLSRRQFLQGTAVAGFAASLPGFLAGCGSDHEHGLPVNTPTPTSLPTPTPTPGRGPRERRTLHFDLSHNGAIGAAYLIALNSESYRSPLQVHDDASRQRFRQTTPDLNAVPDEHLTHYVEGADLPADALQLVTVFGTTGSGTPALLGAYIHIPSPTLQGYAARALRGEAPIPAALVQRSGTGATAEGLGSALTCSNSYVNPLTTAVALCFHYPEVMNLNPTLGANTLIANIQNLPDTCTDPTQGCKFVDEVASWIATHSPATTTPGGWATLVAQTDASGTPVTDQSGNPVYRSDLTDETVAKMTRPIQQILQAIFNDPQYEGTNWNATSGQASIDQSAAPAASGSGAEVQDDTFQPVASVPPGSWQDGIHFVALTVTDPANRMVQLEVKNWFLRYLRVYLQYFDPDGNLIPVAPGPGDVTNADGRASFLTEITSANQIMGIPVPATPSCLDFQIPANASTARVIFGSIGMGGSAFVPEAVVGAGLTIGLNIGIPTMFLALGLGLPASGIFKAVEPALATLFTDALQTVDVLASYSTGIYGSATSNDITCFLSAAGDTLIKQALGSPVIAEVFYAAVGVEQTADSVPFAGWAFRTMAIAGTLYAIGETITEILTCQAVTVNDITYAFEIATTIERDPSYGQFPLEAKTYEVTVTSSASNVSYTTGGTVPSQSTGPIIANITGVPSGGTVTIEVTLVGDAGLIVATGSSGPLPASLAGAGAVTVQLTNHPVPLTNATQYQHDLKLAYQDGAHVWVPNLPAPSATAAGAPYRPSQVTFSPTTLMLGYGWQTDGLGVGQCGGGSGGILYAFQNVSAGQSADSGLKFPGCGFILPAGLAYDPKGPASGVGNNFFVEPSADGDGFYLRSVILDTTTPFNLNQGMNWGRFTQALNSIVVHPAGYVVGVSAATSTMEILRLPSAPVSDSDPPMSPWATMRCGYGRRPGLMNTPIAVTVNRGAILVLEQGNLRIQAFDVNANPVARFARGTTSFAALAPESDTVVYVDLACDTLGYLFVLSYVGDGDSAADYRLDIYDPDGRFLARTTGIAAGRMTVDPLRTVYTVNYEALAGAPRVEPSLSQWLPSIPTS